MTSTQHSLIDPDQLWIGSGGEVLCGRHAGGYLTAAITARPKAKSHTTPFGRFAKATAADQAEWDSYDLGPLSCERCQEAADRASR